MKPETHNVDDEMIRRALVHIDEAKTLLHAILGSRSLPLAAPVRPIDEVFLESKVADVDFAGYTARIYNCLHNQQIETVRDLVSKTESDMLRIGNFGHKSLAVLKSVLAMHGLQLGMPANER